MSSICKHEIDYADRRGQGNNHVVEGATGVLEGKTIPCGADMTMLGNKFVEPIRPELVCGVRTVLGLPGALFSLMLKHELMVGSRVGYCVFLLVLFSIVNCCKVRLVEVCLLGVYYFISLERSC